MVKNNMVKIWLAEIRANFLILSVVLVMVGGTAAWHDGHFDLLSFIITVVGVVCAHISVDLFNEYSDWRTGIDDKTNRTPFSGGSGNLQKGLLKPSQVKAAAYLSLAVSFFIGVWLAWISGWIVVFLMIIGGLAIVFYTDIFAKWVLGELMAGVALGSFVVIGAYYVQTGVVNSMIIWTSISPGILTTLLLFLNEFPDVEADLTGGRRHMVIMLGRHYASYVYASLLMAVYLIIVAGVVLGSLPAALLIGLLTLPVAAAAAVKAVRHAENIEKLVPALGMNVMVVLATDFLLAVGFVIA